MPMDAMVTAVIEASLNQLLNLDKQSPARLRKLVGKVLKLDLRELKPLWFVFSERRLDVLARYEGEPDAVLSLSLTAIGLLKDPFRSDPLYPRGEAGLERRPATGASLQRPAGGAGHRLGRGAVALYRRRAGSYPVWRRPAGPSRDRPRAVPLPASAGQFLTEEARLAPGPLEVASFNDDVEVLAQQMKAVELRLARLEQQVS